MPQVSAAHTLAQQILNDTATQDPTGLAGQVVIRAFEQLRGALVRLIGVEGFRALLTRAQREAPWLAAVTVTAEGALVGFSEAAHGQDPAAVTAGGQALLAHFLGLLHTFIGETLTLRLLADGWPDASFDAAPPAPQETTT
jgi:hypothetical protein